MCLLCHAALCVWLQEDPTACGLGAKVLLLLHLSPDPLPHRVCPQAWATSLLTHSRTVFAHRPDRWQLCAYRHAVALGGAGNILLLVAANLVGFAIDAEGGLAAAARMLTTGDGLRVLGCALATLFVGVQLDLEIEARRATPTPTAAATGHESASCRGGGRDDTWVDVDLQLKRST